MLKIFRGFIRNGKLESQVKEIKNNKLVNFTEETAIDGSEANAMFVLVSELIGLGMRVKTERKGDDWRFTAYAPEEEEKPLPHWGLKFKKDFS